MGTSTKIVLVIPANRLCGWHADLADRLRAAGFRVGLQQAASVAGGAGPRLALGLDALTARRKAESLRAVAASAIAPAAEGEGAFFIHFCAVPSGSEGGHLQVLFDGSADESHAIAALLRGRPAHVALADTHGRVVAQGRPSIEYPFALGLACGQYFHRVGDLIVKALSKPEPSGAPLAQGLADLSPAEAVGRSGLRLAQKIFRRALRPVYRADHWQVGWRRLEDGDGLGQRGVWPAAPWQWLPDDGRGFLADPFLFEHEGNLHLFVEEFPYATGKGVLSHALFDGTGFSAPRVILEEPFHLSYPQVFARQGAIWMIPETAQAGAIRLYHAGVFPEGWEHVADLVPGSWSDATLVEHGGRLWLFATDSAPGGSTWDSLHLFSAEKLMGPWQAHPANPVLVDARAARPAGPMFHHDGALWRPVQDCSSGYGAALGLARVDRLDPESYAQTLMAHLPPPPSWRADGVHTLGRAGGIEVVDRVRPLWGWRG